MELINGDSLELISSVGYVDFLLTDPPYEIATQGGGIIKQREFTNQIKHLNISTGFDVFNFLNKSKCLFPTIQDYNGVFFCSNLQLHDYLFFAIANKLQYLVMVWHKTNPAPLCNNKYLGDVEYIVYIKGKNKKIYGKFESKSCVYSSSTNKKDKELYNHPTIKPLELIKKYIINHTLKGDIVFDPFMGTGTTGVAATLLNREFIGIEMDDYYYDVAKKRIETYATESLEDIF